MGKIVQNNPGNGIDAPIDKDTPHVSTRPAEHNIAVVYDGECPFCQQYMRLLRLRASAGEVRLIDARSDDPMVSEALERGYDLDEGMVVNIADRFYHGADAMQVLAMLSSRSGWFNRFNYRVFSSPRVATLLYPVLRSGRNLTLRALGRKPIDESKT